MVFRLVTLLCIELQVNDVTERASLNQSLQATLEGKGGKLGTSIGSAFDVFLFESPTEAVLAGQRALEQPEIVRTAKAKVVVHTAEINLDPTTLESRIVKLVHGMLNSAPWGHFLISEASFLSLKLSEVGDVEETSLRLKAEQRSFVMYRLRVESIDDSRTARKDLEMAKIRRASKAASFDRRILASSIDYLIAVCLLLCCLVIRNLPGIWKVYGVRKVLEFEDFALIMIVLRRYLLVFVH